MNNISGWWFLKHGWMIFHFIYGLSSWSHWRTPSFFGGVGIPPTSICNVCVHTWHDMTWILHTYGRWFHIVLSFNKTWGDQCQVVDNLWDDLKPAIQMGTSRYEDYEVWNGMKQQDSDHATIGHVTQQDTCNHSDWGTRRFDWQGLRLHCGHESETWFGYNVGKTMINHP